MSLLTLAAMATSAVLCARAEAYPVTFWLTDTVYNANALNAGASNGALLGAFQLTIDSAAVSRGSKEVARGPGLD